MQVVQDLDAVSQESGNSEPLVWEARITFQRIQTYLLAVPKLREAIGSNVLLGESVRRDLTRLAKDCHAACPPNLLPADDFFEKLPCDDPLANAPSEIDRDDPYFLLIEYGVSARDGGHFAALFADASDAYEFKRRATFDLHRSLDGLQFEAEVQPLAHISTAARISDSSGAGNGADQSARDKNDTFRKLADVVHLYDLPLFQVCEAAGTGPASASYPDPDTKEPILISAAVQRRRQAAEEFFPLHWVRGKGVKRLPPSTHDIVGLMYPNFLPDHLEPAHDLKDLADGRYLAVIHADGNGIGKRGHAYKERVKADFLSDPIASVLVEERLFYSMRVAVRRALVDALAATFGGYGKDDDKKKRPYQVLMLGGDDLLLVCQAPYALDFVVNYATELRRYPLADDKPLSIGAGVVLASNNIPFHHLHELAEGLAASAKRLFRQCGETNEADNPSVVDWMVCTYSWSDDPIAVRKATALKRYRTKIDGDIVNETLALTARPYRVLPREGEGGGPNKLGSLKGLLGAAASLSEQEIKARSQLRTLKGNLAKGRRWSDLEYRELPKETKELLDKVLAGSLWVNPESDQQNLPQGFPAALNGTDPPVSNPGAPTRMLTYLGDLVEVLEIPSLGEKGD